VGAKAGVIAGIAATLALARASVSAAPPPAPAPAPAAVGVVALAVAPGDDLGAAEQELAAAVGISAVSPLLARARAAPVPAPDDLAVRVDAVRVRTRDGWRSYLAVDGAAARTQLTAALDGAVAIAGWTDGAARLVEPALRLGVVLAFLGETAASEDHLRLALAIQPALALDPAEYSPDVIALVDAARRPGTTAPVAWSLPSGAGLELDGALVHAPPDMLPVGLHVVVVRAPGRGADGAAGPRRGGARAPRRGRGRGDDAGR
jgi:hypothetical protein